MVKKQEILRVAAQLLKEHGYDKTTYKIIADALGISKSIITYHFKSKPLLVSYIFEEYINEISKHIKSNLTSDCNCYLHRSIIDICLYREVLKNDMNKNLFFHEDLLKLWSEEKLSSIEGYIQEIANDFNVNILKEDIYINAVICQSVKKGLFYEYKRNPRFISEYKLCNAIASMTGILSGLDESTVLKNLMRAYEFIDRYSYPKIDLLN